MILKQCKGVHCVDLGESFQTHIYLQNLASIQPRTSPLKFAMRVAGRQIRLASDHRLAVGPLEPPDVLLLPALDHDEVSHLGPQSEGDPSEGRRSSSRFLFFFFFVVVIVSIVIVSSRLVLIFVFQ